jgi:hypothetical protein
MHVPTLVEGPRGCGHRQPGGLYLMAGAPAEPCPLLPLELTVCPVCGGGLKPARGWTWVDADALLDLPRGPHGRPRHAAACPFSGRLGAAGLIWVGAGFYGKPHDFLEEAGRLGISRRISHLPKGLEIGKTWVLLAHRNALGPPEPQGEDRPGVFSAFRPTRIEYVVRGDESEEQLEALVARGIQPVRVERADETLDPPS